MDAFHMPISKEDALRSTEERDSPEYASFCDKIDGAIKDRAGTSMQITIGIGNTPSHIVDRAIEQYRSIGWDCERVSDQREGDFLLLR